MEHWIDPFFLPWNIGSTPFSFLDLSGFVPFLGLSPFWVCKMLGYDMSIFYKENIPLGSCACDVELF